MRERAAGRTWGTPYCVCACVCHKIKTRNMTCEKLTESSENHEVNTDRYKCTVHMYIHMYTHKLCV